MDEIEQAAEELGRYLAGVYMHPKIPLDQWIDIAETVIESDWLAKHDRENREETFEEGYEAAYGDLLDRDPHRTKNPYAQGPDHD